MDDFEDSFEDFEEDFEDSPKGYYGGYDDDDYVSADSEYEDEF
ncbi:hypothetical protein HBZC1_04290 [Helicobacter bizzozeronii CIII-1]|uniref:Highly acidic protein n=1 Tax=Helicobacter bizzozeronii (strain CIII-1) TaxID=1002804 RepID=F8KRM8_HELBC|nr:hypothetical protein [Helicobacter bizzozeronii]CCB79415.1 hypothetical protein HBZC1_04290 [Helicobacter bizzozeronii CIII-1]